MFIPNDKKEIIISRAQENIEDIISYFTDVKKNGTSGLSGKCPKCKVEKALKIDKKKNIYKCFKCGFGGNSSISYLMEGHDKTYPEALKLLAEKYNILIEQPPPVVNNKNSSKTKLKSYCLKALEDVGLTYDDVSACVLSDDQNTDNVSYIPTFQPGSMDQFGRLTNGVDDDDMIIHYYDLAGKQITYSKKGSTRNVPFYRIRWKNPSLHLDLNGNPYKYHSPVGGGTHLYIPEVIRKAFKNRHKISTLYIQEGEKKAEKCCKHGIMSVGISGIHCIASKNALPAAFQQIIQACEVENIVLLFDSDWDEISANIRMGDRVDQRPRTFMSAAINFKNYFRAFFPQGIYFEIYFGHIQKGFEKGIDDLLAGTLKKKEKDLSKELLSLLSQKEPTGKYVRLFRVTSWTSEYKFEMLWNLQSAQEFALKYKDTLKNLPEFKIGRHLWRFREGKFESAQPLENDEQYWQIEEWEDKSGRLRKQENFDYANCYNFLKNRGFGRISMQTADFVFGRLVNKVIIPQDPWQIRDFVTEFTKQVAPKSILNMLFRGGPQYLGMDKLSNMDFVFPNYFQPDKQHQYIYFKEKAWRITASEIKELDIKDIDHNIWTENVRSFDAKKLGESLIEVERIDDDFLGKLKPEVREQYSKYKNAFLYDITKTGSKCHFLKFLENASNFTWRKDKKDITLDDKIENGHHFIAKLCSMGYLLHEFKNKSITKAVVGMDGNLTEVGTSNGRSGKSLLGDAIGEAIHQCYIPGKAKNMTEDSFIFDGVDEKHKNVFIDDVRTNFDFEFLFPAITSNLVVNKKGDKRFSISFYNSPKFYITTNHALNGDGTSFRDRQWLIAFSDFYNDTHKPVDDFGIPFFDDWSYSQRNLFFNLMAACVQLYLRFGIVESPNDRLEQRRLRQKIGEDFLTWADEYFSQIDRMNFRLIRKQMYDDLTDNFPNVRKYITAARFKKKIQAYCEYKGYDFNPHKYDESTGIPQNHDKDGRPMIDDKSSGVEYFTIADENFKLAEFIH